jgi:hypothetical protein
MTTTVNLNGSGVPGLTSDAITGFVTTAQAATGASQGSLTLPTDIVVYSTSTASNGPTLPSTAQSGDSYFIANNTANSINVWPSTGGAIGSGSANAALAVPAGKTAKFISVGGVNWVAIVSA